MFDERRCISTDGTTLTGPSLRLVTDDRTDTELVEAIGHGDRDALLEVFDAHAATLYEVARRRCAPGRAADAVEKVMLGLWHRPEAYEGTGSTLRELLVAQARAESSLEVRGRPSEAVAAQISSGLERLRARHAADRRGRDGEITAR